MSSKIEFELLITKFLTVGQQFFRHRCLLEPQVVLIVENKRQILDSSLTVHIGEELRNGVNSDV